MLSYTCSGCAASFERATLDEADLTCPSCAKTVDRGDPTGLSIMQRTGPGGGPKLAKIALTPAFRARYRLGRVLGTGGMGLVLQARDLEAERTVAIKFLTGDEDPHHLARFLREGELLLKLAHPHVMRVHEMAEASGFPYLVCEFLEGGTLTARLEQALRLPADQAVDIAAQVLDGLAACHDAGIVHRDLKPDNILFDGHDRAKLTDLGIARLGGAEDRLTQTGAILGTPRYMAPEQVRGEPADAAGDVYTSMRRIVEDAPAPIEDAAPQTPAGVAAAVHRALAKDRAARPASARAFRELLEAGLDTPPLQGRAPLRLAESGAIAVPRPRRRWPLIVLAMPVLLTALAGGLAWKAHLPRESPVAPASPLPSSHVFLQARASSKPDGEEEKLLERAVANDPGDAIARVNLGVCRMNAGKLDDAYALFTAARALNANLAEVHRNLGAVEQMRGHLPQAEQHFRDALRVDPGFAQARKELGALLMGTGRVADGKRELEEALRQDPRQADAWDALGYIAETTGNVTASEALFRRALAVDPQLASAHENLGLKLAARNLYDEAEEHFRTAIRARPSLGMAYVSLGFCMRRKKRIAEAEELYRTGLRESPRTPQLHYSLGELLMARGRNADAEPHFRHAIELAPQWADCMNSPGGALQLQGKLDEAERWYREALRLDPNLGKAATNLAGLLAQKRTVKR